MAAYRALTQKELVHSEEEIPFLVSLLSLLHLLTLVSSQHGDLRVHVIAARDLPDTDNTFFNISRGDWTDPFVTVFLDQVNSALNASSVTTGQTLSSPSFLMRLILLLKPLHQQHTYRLSC